MSLNWGWEGGDIDQIKLQKNEKERNEHIYITLGGLSYNEIPETMYFKLQSSILREIL